MNFLAQQQATALNWQVESAIFFAMAALAVVGAWSIVLSQNVVRMAIYLLLTLAGAAGMYLLLGAEFLSAIQLIVYAGGTLILIIFGVMLTSKNPSMKLETALWERAVGVFIGLLVAGMLFWALVNSALPHSDEPPPGSVGAMQHEKVAMIGRSLLSDQLVAFEVAGVVLLVVMIGAAYLARRPAR